MICSSWIAEMRKGTAPLAFPALVAVLCMLCVSSTAQAVLVWNNGTFDVVPGSGEYIGSIAAADDFVLPGTATLSDFTVWVHDHPPNATGTLDNFGGAMGYAVYSDSAGSVGSLVASGTASPTLTDTGINAPNGERIFKANAGFGGSGLTLGPGAYWFSVRDGAWGSAYDGSDVVWRGTQTSHGSAPRVDADEASPTFPTLSGVPGWAFELNGVVAGTDLVWDNGTFDTVPGSGVDVTANAGVDEFELTDRWTLTAR